MKQRSPYVFEVRSDCLIVRERLNGAVLKRIELERPAVEPVVKWAGGKQWLAWAAPFLTPDRWKGHYYEPFAGGAAFFFALEPGHATIADRNQELVSTYRALRGDVEGVIRLLRSYPHDAEFYYRLRARTPQTPRALAARFLYLNKTCWNGLYRTNQWGKFNTPAGRFKNPTICDVPRLTEAARLLKRPTLRHGDFEVTVAEAAPGDFVYFDPPYITGHQNNGFLKYNKHLFSWDDQKRLAKVARQLAARGVHVLVSNADHQAVLPLYEGLYFYRALRRSAISGTIDSRGVVSEALLSSYPLLGYQSEVLAP